MSALHCSIAQALDVYADVAMAWAGVNGFGGHTAEIYAYRLWPYSPRSIRETAVEEEANGRADLATICRHAEKGLGGTVTIDGATIDGWEERFRFDHRAHVRFEPSEKGSS